jgi:hypothetical protein
MGQANLSIETTLHDHAQPTTISVAQDQDQYPSAPADVLELSSLLGKLVSKFDGDAVAGLLFVLRNSAEDL